MSTFGQAPADRQRRSVHESLAERHWPSLQATSCLQAKAPSAEICFLTVADYRFCRGLEALLLGLLAIYPALSSTVFVVHDGTLSTYLRNRLLSIYKGVRFVVPAVSWAAQLPENSANRKRIGVLGYLNAYALSLRDYRRVIVLDADLLIEGPLDCLWEEGEAFRMVPDCGARPWTPISPATKRPVLNSGLISVPGTALTASAEARIADLIGMAAEPYCPLLDRFADQKIWNQFLIDCPVQLLPINLNCNAKYLFRYLGGVVQGLSVIHFAGPKPWLTWPWFEPAFDYLEADPTFPAACWLWNDRYCRLLARWRTALFREVQQQEAGLGSQASAVVSGALQALLEPAASGSSRHLLMADANAFGGFACDQPHWPGHWLEALTRLEELHVWMPFELEPLIRDLPRPPHLHLHWLLIEAPFSRELKARDASAELASAESSPRFEPWAANPIEALAHAVLQRLEQASISVDLRI